MKEKVQGLRIIWSNYKIKENYNTSYIRQMHQLMNQVFNKVGLLLWNRGLQMLTASSGGLFFFFQPIVGTFLGWLLLGEQIGWSFWIGTILISIGVFLVIREE